MNPLYIFISGIPASKGSWIVRYGRLIPDNRQKLETWTCAIRKTASATYSPAPPTRGAIELKLKFYLPPPRITEQGRPATTRPDIDKLARAVLDALAGIIYVDDCQVIKMDVSKEYDFNGLNGCDIEIRGRNDQ